MLLKYANENVLLEVHKYASTIKRIYKMMVVFDLLDLHKKKLSILRTFFFPINMILT